VSANPERRDGPDRRIASRGGRRPTDIPGALPLVIVADDEGGSRTVCETILAKLNFAVAPVDSVARALEVMMTLRPAAVVARVRDAAPLHAVVQVPLVIVTAEMSDPEVLVGAIRRALRHSHAP
jgi:hypothetical protein